MFLGLFSSFDLKAMLEFCQIKISVTYMKTIILNLRCLGVVGNYKNANKQSHAYIIIMITKQCVKEI
jgi:hypothetical protein